MAITASVGSDHTCALTSGAGLKCWGNNGNGQLGDNSTTRGGLVPVDVSGLTSGAAAVSAGQFHTCALTTGGGAKCWGFNGNGQIGDGTQSQRLTPVDVQRTDQWRNGRLRRACPTAACVTGAGGVKCWGLNANGQLGDGTTTQRLTAVNVNGLSSGIAAIAAGAGHTCALTTVAASSVGD